MAHIDAKKKKIQAKIVYYGPGLCGKTTNLEHVNKAVPNTQEMMSLSTEGDRTIFFDYLPMELGKIRGIDTTFKLYTVPGQVRYNRTRKMVLKNVDGVVFVADSQPMMADANLESLDNLFANLAELNIDGGKLPLVLQYNKRDLPGVVEPAVLDAALNSKGHPVYLASALKGDGVIETLQAIANLVFKRLVSEFGLEMEVPAPQPAQAPAQAAAPQKPAQPAGSRQPGQRRAPRLPPQATPRPAAPRQAAPREATLQPSTPQPSMPQRSTPQPPTSGAPRPEPMRRSSAGPTRQVPPSDEHLAGTAPGRPPLHQPAMTETPAQAAPPTPPAKTELPAAWPPPSPPAPSDGLFPADDDELLTEGRYPTIGETAGDANRDNTPSTFEPLPTKPKTEQREASRSFQEFQDRVFSAFGKQREELGQLLSKCSESLVAMSAKVAMQTTDASKSRNTLDKVLVKVSKLTSQLESLSNKEFQGLDQTPTASDPLLKTLTSALEAALTRALDELRKELPGRKELESLRQEVARPTPLPLDLKATVAAVADGNKKVTVALEQASGRIEELRGSLDRGLGELRQEIAGLPSAPAPATATAGNRQVEEERQKAQAELERAKEATRKAQDEQRKAKADLKQAEKAIRKAQDEQRKAKADLKQAEQVRGEIKEAQEELRKAEQARAKLEKVREELGKAEQARAELEKTQEALQKTREELEKAEQARAELEKTQEALKKTREELEKAEQARAELEKARAQAPAAETAQTAPEAAPEKAQAPAAETAQTAPEAEPEEPEAKAEEPAETKPEQEAEPEQEAGAKPDGEPEEKPEEPAEAKPEQEAEPEQEAGAKPNGEPEEQPEEPAKGKPEQPEEDFLDDPAHKNAARVARVMVADLNLYYSKDVQEGIKAGDFDERMKDALEDMRKTFEERVPEEVRVKKDYLRLAIDKMIAKKRQDLGLG